MKSVLQPSKRVAKMCRLVNILKLCLLAVIENLNDYDENFDAKDLVYKLNSFLPKDVAIQQIFKVKPEAHARFDAVSRTYHYKVSTSKNVFDYDFAYEVQLPLNVDAMNKACKILFEYRDFQCFSKSNTDVKTYNCDSNIELPLLGHLL